MIDNKCHCKDCRKAKRKGLVIGTRRMTYWCDGMLNIMSSVSDYVPYHRYQKGRRPLVKTLDEY